MSAGRGCHRWTVPAFVCLALLAGGLAFFQWIRRSFTAYAVAGSSMEPAFRPGDYLLIDRRPAARRSPPDGAVVLARDPRAPDRILLKRVGWAEPDGRLWLLGDNRADSTDSRTFGPIAPTVIIGRVMFRYRRSQPAPDRDSS